MRRNQKLVQQLSRLHNLCRLLIIVITAASSALVAFELEFLVPVLLAVAALLDFFISWRSLDTEPATLNATTAVLTQLLLYWDGLSLIKRRMPETKEYLVDTAESALLLQHKATVQASLQSLLFASKYEKPREDPNIFYKPPASGDGDGTGAKEATPRTPRTPARI